MGVEATYLKPNVDDGGIVFNNAFRSFVSSDYADFDGLEGAPRIWLGFENAATGWGIRARYWECDAAAHGGFTDLDIMDLANANVYARVSTVDLEVTRRWARRNWSWLGSFGVRYATLERSESLDYVDLLGAASQTWSAFDFDGTGLTIALEGRRPFGNRGLALACNLRGSAIWGADHASAASVISEGGVYAVQLVETEENNATHYIFEIQAGLEWSRRIECLRGNAFAHCMFEYQRWSSERGCPFSYEQTLNTTTVSGSSLSGALDFTGLAFAVGFTR
jgi:hypothetical protein